MRPNPHFSQLFKENVKPSQLLRRSASRASSLMMAAAMAVLFHENGVVLIPDEVAFGTFTGQPEIHWKLFQYLIGGRIFEIGVSAQVLEDGRQVKFKNVTVYIPGSDNIHLDDETVANLLSFEWLRICLGVAS